MSANVSDRHPAGFSASESGSGSARVLVVDDHADIRDSLADISKANRLLGYQPQIRIREGLQQTLAWFKANQGFIQERN